MSPAGTEKCLPPNILPFDGDARYFNAILSTGAADQYFETLAATISWKQDEIIIFGKRVVTKRRMAWYAVGDIPYRYSKITRNALPFTGELLALRQLVETVTGESYNACL